MKTEIYQGTGDSERVVKARVNGRWIHVARCAPSTEVVGISMGEVAFAESGDAHEVTPWFEVLAVGPKCRYFRPQDVGGLILLPVSGVGKRQWTWLVGKGELMVREEWYDELPDDNGMPCLAVFRKG